HLIFHARYRDGDNSPNLANKRKFLRLDSLFLRARLRVGIPVLTTNIEGGFIHDDPHMRRSDNLYPVLLQRGIITEGLLLIHLQVEKQILETKSVLQK